MQRILLHGQRHRLTDAAAADAEPCRRDRGAAPAMPGEERPVTLRRLIDGHKVTQAIRAAVELGLPDRIASGTQDPAEQAACGRRAPALAPTPPARARRAWGELLHSVRTGESAYRHVHGMDAWEYRATHPESAAVFDAARTDLSRRTDRSLLEAYDFSRFGTIVDLGGGRGALLAALLAAHLHQHGETPTC